MRVIHHKQRQEHHQRQNKRKKKRILLFSTLLILTVGVAAYNVLYPKKTEAPKANSTQNQSTPDTNSKRGVLKTFTAQQFRDLYNNFAYPNTERISEKTPITGNSEADEHIRKMAIAKGYTIRSAPVANTFIEVEAGMLLQERASEPWGKIRDAAKKDDVALGLSAAYRSADEQKELFLARLFRTGVDISRISSGAYDSSIATVLQTTALPGYSRHHSGYTIDLTCIDNPYVRFNATNCFQWLSKNNYENTKKHGWIPSYPEGVGQQGPEPEAWEYVWVGIDSLTK